MSEQNLQWLMKQNPEKLKKIHAYISAAYDDLARKCDNAKQIYVDLLKEREEEIGLKEALVQELKILEEGTEETTTEIREEIALLKQIQELASVLKNMSEALMIAMNTITRYKAGKADIGDLNWDKEKLDYLSDIPEIEKKLEQIGTEIARLKSLHGKSCEEIKALESSQEKGTAKIKQIRSETTLAFSLFGKMSEELAYLKSIIAEIKKQFSL